MELQPKCSKALDEWINSGKWHMDCPPDTKLFYQFIDQYQKEHGNQIDEPVLSMEIRLRLLAKGRPPTQTIQKATSEWLAFMSSVLEFLEVTER